MLKILGAAVLVVLAVYAAFFFHRQQKATEYYGNLEPTGTAVVKPLEAGDPDILTFRYPEEDFPEIRTKSEKIPGKMFASRINTGTQVDLMAESTVDSGGQTARMILIRTEEGKMGYAHDYQLASKDGSRMGNPPSGQ
ncbi:MAG: hypothetical protein V2A74_06845 [bacterium]